MVSETRFSRLPLSRFPNFLISSAILCVSLLAGPLTLFAQTKGDCLMCHSDKDLTMEKRGKSISLHVDEARLHASPHKKLVCVACHVGFNAEEMPHKAKIDPVNCLTCHKDSPQRHAFHPQMARASGKNGRPDISCKQCHGTHDVSSSTMSGGKFSSRNLTESCGSCHRDIKEKFIVSEHGRPSETGAVGTPTCLTCHLTKITNGTRAADTLGVKLAQEKMCLSCHLDNPDVRARMTPSAGFIAAYEQSVHGRQLLGGNARAANCVDCHGSHEMQKGLDPRALVSKEHIPTTCAKCHQTIAKEFDGSAHGEALRKRNTDAPVCTNCHGEHAILAPSDPRSPVSPTNVSAEVCSPCHSSVRLNEKYGIAGDRSATFRDSYHGLALRGGDVEAANCASCHGFHDIRSSRDPSSPVHKSNLAATCGKCHPGANERWAIGPVHVNLETTEEPILYWIATIYIFLIVILIGGMLVHNLFDFLRKARKRLMIRRGLIAEEHVGHRLYLRMTSSERIQHASLMMSFILLVITGFMLRYPEAWWVESIRSLSGGVFEMRSLLHRIAGVVMLVASTYHIYYVAFTARGRQLIFDLLPRLQDVGDAVGVVKYNFGLSKVKPKLGRFSYIEKSEYWALVWGTLIMAASGFIMWFDNTFIGLFTKLGYDIAREIHFYEAWLATLAIIVWHVYYVIFNPDIYPMNLAWLTGTITETEMAEEHPAELEEIKRQELGEIYVGEESAEDISVGQKSEKT